MAFFGVFRKVSSGALAAALPKTAQQLLALRPATLTRTSLTPQPLAAGYEIVVARNPLTASGVVVRSPSLAATRLATLRAVSELASATVLPHVAVPKGPIATGAFRLPLTGPLNTFRGTGLLTPNQRPFARAISVQPPSAFSGDQIRDPARVAVAIFSAVPLVTRPVEVYDPVFPQARADPQLVETIVRFATQYPSSSASLIGQWAIDAFNNSPGQNASVAALPEPNLLRALVDMARRWGPTDAQGVFYQASSELYLEPMLLEMVVSDVWANPGTGASDMWDRVWARRKQSGRVEQYGYWPPSPPSRDLLYIIMQAAADVSHDTAGLRAVLASLPQPHWPRDIIDPKLLRYLVEAALATDSPAQFVYSAALSRYQAPGDGHSTFSLYPQLSAPRIPMLLDRVTSVVAIESASSARRTRAGQLPSAPLTRAVGLALPPRLSAVSSAAVFGGQAPEPPAVRYPEPTTQLVNAIVSAARELGPTYPWLILNLALSKLLQASLRPVPFRVSVAALVSAIDDGLRDEIIAASQRWQAELLRPGVYLAHDRITSDVGSHGAITWQDVQDDNFVDSIWSEAFYSRSNRWDLPALVLPTDWDSPNRPDGNGLPDRPLLQALITISAASDGTDDPEFLLFLAVSAIGRDVFYFPGLRLAVVPPSNKRPPGLKPQVVAETGAVGF